MKYLYPLDIGIFDILRGFIIVNELNNKGMKIIK